MHFYFAFIGSICVVFALWLIARRLTVLLVGKDAIGTVLSSEKRQMGDTEGEVIAYVPTVAFVDDQGRPYQFTSISAFSRPTPKTGTLIKVRYLPSAPSLAYILSFKHMWPAPLALAVLGAGGLATLLIY